MRVHVHTKPLSANRSKWAAWDGSKGKGLALPGPSRASAELCKVTT